MENQQQQTTSKVEKTEREQLRNQRTQNFLVEPARDGNPLVVIPAGTSDSGAAVREAENSMKIHIESIMKPSDR